MIKAVFLDVDNTLLDFDLCAVRVMRQCFEEFGLAFETSMYYDTFTRINNPLWEQIERGELTREELFRVRWTLIFRALGIDFDGPTFEKRFLALLETTAVPVPGAPELVFPFLQIAGQPTLSILLTRSEKFCDFPFCLTKFPKTDKL